MMSFLVIITIIFVFVGGYAIGSIDKKKLESFKGGFIEKELKIIEKLIHPNIGKKYTLYNQDNDIKIKSLEKSIFLMIDNKEYYLTPYEFYQTYKKFHRVVNKVKQLNLPLDRIKIIMTLIEKNESQLYDTREDAEIARNEIYLNKIR